MREVTRMLKAIHAQESKEAARKKAKDVVEPLRAMKLKEAAKKVEDGIIHGTLYCHCCHDLSPFVRLFVSYNIHRIAEIINTFSIGIANQKQRYSVHCSLWLWKDSTSFDRPICWYVPLRQCFYV